jgi:hypothetical protein
MYDFDLYDPNWYKIKVIDFWGLETIGNGVVVVDQPLPPDLLYPNNEIFRCPSSLLFGWTSCAKQLKPVIK